MKVIGSMRPMTGCRLAAAVAVIAVSTVRASAGDATVSAADAPAAKFNPGHYVALPVTGDPKAIQGLETPGIVGVSKRYKWRRLEPRRGEYDFAEMSEDLEYLAERDRRLVVFLIDRSFSRWPSLPRYLAEHEIAIDGGTCPVRWHPEVVRRMVALGQAIGEAFDHHPHFEGVAIQETSLGLPADLREAHGYTHEAYRDALIEVLTGLADAMPRSRVFWYQNFFPDGEQGYLRQIANALLGKNVVMGGPDILPHRRYMRQAAYPLYDEYRGKLPLFCAAQNDSYKHHANDVRLGQPAAVPDSGYLTMGEIFRFARDELHVSYIFWDHRTEAGQPGERTFDDALEVIRGTPRFNPQLTAVFAPRAEAD